MEKELRKEWIVRISIHGIVILTNVGTRKMLQNAILISLITLRFDMCLISDDDGGFCPILCRYCAKLDQLIALRAAARPVSTIEAHRRRLCLSLNISFGLQNNR